MDRNLTLSGLPYKIGVWMASIGFVRSAIQDRADLSAFDHRPTVRIVLGVFMIGFSFLIGWPAISTLGGISLYFRQPLIAVIGGPLLYGLSHLCFLGGMALSGAKYARLFLRWLSRVVAERLLACGPGESALPQEALAGDSVKSQIDLLSPSPPADG